MNVLVNVTVNVPGIKNRVFDIFSGCFLMISGRERAPARARKNLAFSWNLSGLCHSFARYYPLIPSKTQKINVFGYVHVYEHEHVHVSGSTNRLLIGFASLP